MLLKDYQQTALDQLDRYLDALKNARMTGEKAALALAEQGIEIPAELSDYPRAAWKELKKQNALPAPAGAEVPAHIPRTAASGAPIPHVCLKVPTGGGKTLLGVAALERIKSGAGFVLWIVPTTAIYAQTVRAFRTREHPYRQRLEQISGGKVKLLEKSDRFTKQDVENYLCVMMLMLPAANRRRNKEFLKIFRDSGGYDSFFPAEDDAAANRELLEAHADLETKAGRRVREAEFVQRAETHSPDGDLGRGAQSLRKSLREKRGVRAVGQPPQPAVCAGTFGDSANRHQQHSGGHFRRRFAPRGDDQTPGGNSQF